METENYFLKLYNTDVSGKVKQKNNLSYLSWSSAWAEVKKVFPKANYTIYKNEQGWNYFTDGRTCWVEVGVSVEGIEHIIDLPVMDFKNQSIAADQVKSTEVNKAIMRALTKACAMHGLGGFIFEGEDLPEIVNVLADLRAEVKSLILSKCALSESAKAKVAELCKSADPSANGDPMLMEDETVLRTLKKSLLGIRK